jgi:hypothetical protein
VPFAATTISPFALTAIAEPVLVQSMLRYVAHVNEAPELSSLAANAVPNGVEQGDVGWKAFAEVGKPGAEVSPVRYTAPDASIVIPLTGIDDWLTSVE